MRPCNQEERSLWASSTHHHLSLHLAWQSRPQAPDILHGPAKSKETARMKFFLLNPDTNEDEGLQDKKNEKNYTWVLRKERKRVSLGKSLANLRATLVNSYHLKASRDTVRDYIRIIYREALTMAAMLDSITWSNLCTRAVKFGRSAGLSIQQSLIIAYLSIRYWGISFRRTNKEKNRQIQKLKKDRPSDQQQVSYQNDCKIKPVKTHCYLPAKIENQTATNPRLGRAVSF